MPMLFYKQVDANWIKAGNDMSMAVAYYALAYRKKIKLPSMEYAEWVNYSVFDKRRKAFPVGLWKYVKEKAHKRGYTAFLTTISINPLGINLDYKLPQITYEPYQSAVLGHLRLYKRGIIVASTGAGKSIIIGGIIKRLSIPKTLIIVINKTIFTQIRDSLFEWFPNTSIGVIGDNQFSIGHITLSLFQSLDKVNQKDFQLVILDEVQRVNNTVIKWLNEFGKKIHYRYGLTATPHKEGDNFEKTMDMNGFFGNIISDITDEQTSARVIPVKVYMIRFKNTKPTENDYQSSLRHDILLNEERNLLLLKAAKKLLLDNGLSCLILLDEIRQAKVMEKVAIKMGLHPYLAHSKNQSGINEKIQNDLDNGKINLVIATQVFGIGTNIPNVDGVVLASAKKSEIDTLQKIGRGRRRTLKKKELILIDSIDQVVSSKKVHRHFYNYSIERMRIYEEKGWEINRLLIV